MQKNSNQYNNQMDNCQNKNAMKNDMSNNQMDNCQNKNGMKNDMSNSQYQNNVTADDCSCGNSQSSNKYNK